MSHKKRREQFLKTKERQRMREEPVMPAPQPAMRELTPYDFGLFHAEAPRSSQMDELIDQQRRAADWVELSTVQSIVSDIQRRGEAARAVVPQPHDFSLAQSVIASVNQDLQTRELYQIHKALNGGFYLP